jgi:hypothetical protein
MTVAATLRRGVRAIAPATARARYARWLAIRAQQHLARLAAEGKPIVAGPWTSEVGFELLYWIPFLRWFTATFAVERERITVVSRGGVASWYDEVAHEYVELFEHVSPLDVRAWREQRLEARGSEKHVRRDATEEGLLRSAGVLEADAEWLHPSLMYRLLNPVWAWGAPLELVLRHTRHARLPEAPRAAAEVEPPYVAVKAYFSRCLPETGENRMRLTQLVDDLAQHHRVVLLHTGLSADDHSELAPGLNVVDASELLEPATNLGVQTALVRGAEQFVATYGGFSYLGPLVGTPTVAVYSAPAFSRNHLEVMERVARQLDTPYSLRLLAA